MARAMTSCWICSVPTKMSKLSLGSSPVVCKSLTRTFSPGESAESPRIPPVLVPN